MTKEQIEVLIDTVGNEVVSYLNVPVKAKNTWALDDESFEIWKIFIEGDKENE